MRIHKVKGRNKYTRSKFYGYLDRLEVLLAWYDEGSEDYTMEELEAQIRDVLLSANLYAWDEHPEHFKEDWGNFTARFNVEDIKAIVGCDWYNDNIADYYDEEADAWARFWIETIERGTR